jgi:hypothetical protein
MPAATAGLARGVLPGARRQHVAQHHLAHLAGLDLGTLQRFDDGDLAQLVRRQGRERAAEGADRGAGGGNDDDVGVGHGETPLEFRQRSRRSALNRVLMGNVRAPE